MDDTLVFDCTVEEAGPVVHQQFIYVAPSCEAIQNIAVDVDGVIEQQEVESVVGQPLVRLSEQEADNYTLNERIPLSSLPSQAEDFIFVVYGDQEQGVNVPIVCMSLQVDTVEVEEGTNGGSGNGDETPGDGNGETEGETGSEDEGETTGTEEFPEEETPTETE